MDIEFFYYEKIIHEVDVIHNHLKYCKVLVLNCIGEENFEFISILKQKNIVPIQIFIENTSKLDVSDLCHLFNVNEDVRAVITNSDNLIDCAKYISSVLNIECYVITNYICDNIFDKRILIFNKNTIDTYYQTSKLNVIINKIKIDCISTFEMFLLSTVFLLDYLVKCAFTKESVINVSYNKAKSIIIDALFDEGYNETVLCDKAIELGRIIYSQDFNLFPSYRVANLITNKELQVQKNLNTCAFIWKMISKAVKNGFMPIDVDYSERITRLELISQLDKMYLTKGLRLQLQNIEQVDLQDVLKEIDVLNKLYNALLSKYKKMGGTILPLSNSQKQVITLCGDTPLSINAMTAIREFVKL